MTRVSGGSEGGRFFDENGQLRGSQSFSGLSEVYRLNSSIADREESDRPYEENVWIRAALKAISSGFQRLGLQFLDREPGDPDHQEVEHPLATILKKPNRFMTGRSFRRAHAIHYKHDGESIWFLMNAEGGPVRSDPVTGRILEMPVSIVPVRGKLVEVKHSADGMPEAYRYATSYNRTTSNVSPSFPWSSVVHFRDYDPYNVTRGLGDVDALAREADLYFQAFRSMDAGVRNGGDPGGFIIYTHPVDPYELRSRQDVADEEFSGPNASRYKLLEADAKFVPNTVKPSDMQYEQLMTWVRDSILSLLGVPGPVVGIYDNATYNNVETAHREMWTGPNGILSLARETADVLSCELIPRMAGVPGAPQQEVFAHFDSSMIEALRDDVSEKLTLAKDIAAAGVAVSFNEALNMQGVEVERPEDGDRKWVNATLTDLDDPEAGKREMPEPIGGAPAPGDEDEDEDDDADEAESEDEDEDAEEQDEQQSLRGVAFAVTPEETAPERKFRERVGRWLSRYEREQQARLRRIANNGLKHLDGNLFVDDFDAIVNPSAIPEEVWDALLLDSFAWAEKLDREVRVALRDMWSAELAAAHAEAGGVVVSHTDPRVIAQLAKQRNQIRDISVTVQRRVRNALAASFADLAPAGNVREMIKAELPALQGSVAKAFGSKDARASAIARTESGRASNGARFTQFEQSGVETVQWVASVDDATRASHIGVHGTVRKMGEPFANGLRYPHDPSAPAGEVVNCRCKLRPHTIKDPLDDIDVSELDPDFDPLNPR